MKNKILSIISVITFLMGISACHSPEEFNPTVERNIINNLTASFPDDDSDDNSFTSEIDYTNHVITVVFPYNYPKLSDNVLQLSDLKKMRVIADLDNNVYVYPTLLFMDMTKDNFITVKDQTGASTEYKVVAEIRKSNECAITKFNITSLGLSGIINESTKTISLISLESIGEVLADISISHGATISPDPRTVALNYDQDQKITVTAQNGTTKSTYTVKKEIPEKIAAGLRANSAKLIWAKKLTDIGISSSDMTTGIAVTNDYVVINERAKNPIYLNAKNGEKAGTMNISFVGSLTNFYTTSDKDGNILFTNLTPNAGPAFTVWKASGVDQAPEKYIEFTTSLAMGRKLSVSGSLNNNAIITAPIYATSGQFARWQVENGVLKSQTPDIITAQGIGAWGTNADVIYSDPTDLTSDYFTTFYAEPRNLCWMDGKTNSIKNKGVALDGNYVPNAVDHAVFNKVEYVASNLVNPWSWGTADNIYLFDLSSGSLGTQAIDFGSTGLGINGNYGSKILGNTNGNYCGDVVLKVSDDGYYMYIYFMFCNGYVGCVQCDCIDM
ncbi:DUF5018 domain-containing protein [Bacteroides thetaiotaomicron]|jgi:hypothetical protein|uniref:DUF5018 domain-containing protein n=1 Tax=Bacteroides thetaiotaomicron TaxID=818 RepID=UPI00101C3C8C|nr:DUF5018 domain-containing protein [Bacteroides thetaiotaomicron]